MPHRILIADDDKALLGLIAPYLGKSLGYDVTAVESGEEAVDAAMKGHFDLCILDIQMGGISGAETYTRLRHILPEIEAIFFTGGEPLDRTRDFLRFSLPPERLLTKPLENFSHLTRLIIGILGPPSR
jgi:CheY-like chemotaxis protein